MHGEIAVIDASIGDTPAEANLTGALDATTTVYKVSDGRFPPFPTGGAWRYDGVVISGSQTSVYDDHEWMHDLTAWVRSLHRADVPAARRLRQRSSS